MLSRLACSGTVVATAAASAVSSTIDPDTVMPLLLRNLIKRIQFISSAEGSATRKKIVLIAALIGSCSFALNHFYIEPRAESIRKLEESKLDKLSNSSSNSSSSRHKVAVNKIFFQRLKLILSIVIPSWKSKEAIYLNILTVLLVSRTIFSIYIAEILGSNAQALVARKWGLLISGMIRFGLITIPASAVNAGLKYFQEMISLRFRLRLSEYVHDEYLSGVNFYKAANIGDDRIDNADQRVTADIKDFSDEIASLYSGILKPLLDVVLFTYRLGSLLGYQAPLIMHSYFVFSGFVKRKLMPNLGKLVARESELEGYYRTAHNRLITNSEEIAFYDGSQREKAIINNCLHEIYDHVAYHRYVRTLIGIFDGLLVKYYASIAGQVALITPLALDLPFTRSLTTSDLTRDYIRNSQYLQNLSEAVGKLVIVGNKLTSIAGYTSRVSELLEMVKLVNSTGNRPFKIREEEVHPEELQRMFVQSDAWINQWRQRCIETQSKRTSLRPRANIEPHVIGGGEYRKGDSIIFEGVDIVSPEGKLLVEKLNFRVDPGVNVMITGKSSLFRVLAELWPLHSGVLTKPPKESLIQIPQKPYLVLGNLRSQIIYPHTHEDMIALGVTDDDLANLLAIVDPANNILKEWTFDSVRDWFYAFSGGQKQRVAMARLFYHSPKFAILDECTSAVSDEVENTIYETCKKLGITIFTVSHRVSLARHHKLILRFEGKGKWTVLNVKQENEIPNLTESTPTATAKPTESPAPASAPATVPAAAAAVAAVAVEIKSEIKENGISNEKPVEEPKKIVEETKPVKSNGSVEIKSNDSDNNNNSVSQPQPQVTQSQPQPQSQSQSIPATSSANSNSNSTNSSSAPTNGKRNNNRRRG